MPASLLMCASKICTFHCFLVFQYIIDDVCVCLKVSQYFLTTLSITDNKVNTGIIIKESIHYSLIDWLNFCEKMHNFVVNNDTNSTQSSSVRRSPSTSCYQFTFTQFLNVYKLLWSVTPTAMRLFLLKFSANSCFLPFLKCSCVKSFN